MCTHTHTGACTHILREACTHTQTQRNVRLHTDLIEVCTHIHSQKHTYTSSHANQPSTPPYAGTRSICTDSPLLLAPNTLSAQSHKGTQFGSLLSHGDSSIGLSFTGLPVSIIGTWNGSWDGRRRDSRARPLCYGAPVSHASTVSLSPASYPMGSHCVVELSWLLRPGVATLQISNSAGPKWNSWSPPNLPHLPSFPH